jgi:hypothetical protein
MLDKARMTHDEFTKELEKVPDEVLQRISFSMPWQYDESGEGGRRQDEDGFPVTVGGPKDDTSLNRESLQQECFVKFHRNPHVNTSIRGLVGRLTGLGFETSSEIWDIQQVIEETEQDQRNRLYNFWPKFVGRHHIEGELFLGLTPHTDGFVEVDFIDPSVVSFKGDDNTGVIYHPTKTHVPLFYNISVNGTHKYQIPSIFIARYPDLVKVAQKHKDYDRSLQGIARSRKHIYRKFAGYSQFIISWDRGFMSRRAISYLRTVLEWLNHYENLKKYEIDHKKSSGAYVWVFKFEDMKAFRQWLALTDEEKRKTAVGAKLTPGGRLILPPGMTVEAVNPNLTQIKDQDTDIMQMIASGLNEPEDILVGTSKSPFASVKASRGPFSDRNSDEIAYFDRFLRYDFWGNVFWLRAQMNGFPETFRVKMAISWKDKKPEFKKVPRRPEQLIEIAYPISDVIDLDSRTKAMLGVKHGPLSEQLGIPNREVANRLGIGGYGKARLEKATEDDRWPELDYELGVDVGGRMEAGQEPASKAKKPILKRRKPSAVDSK